MPITLTRTAAAAAVALTVAGFACTGTAAYSGARRVYGAYPARSLSDVRPLTHAERTNFTETSTYADVMTFIDSLREISPTLHVTRLGKTSQGKDIPMLVLSRPAVRTPAEAKAANRPIVYLQGNIHGGEVEGKEALLSLLRDFSMDDFPNVLDSLVIIAVPIYNADGNDAMEPQERNRGSQNGPALIGQRPNAQGFDLNRDYIKAEAPETRAAIEMFRMWDPDVFVDLHTTNGSYHGYALTWAPPLNPAAIFTGPYVRDTVLPAVREILRLRFGIQTFPYGNFIHQDSVERGWFTYDHRPRFGTNYYGLRGRIGILSEAYSHDPFRTRVASTYSFTSTLLSVIAANRDDFLGASREADNRTTGFTSIGVRSPLVPIRSRIARQAHLEEMLVEELERTNDTVRTEPGVRPGIRRTGRVRRVQVPVFDRFEPVLGQTLPYAWVIPPEQEAILGALRSNGVFIERTTTPVPARVERFIIDSVVKAPRAFQGHQEVRLTGRWTTDTTTIAAGTHIVRAGQPLGILTLYLLEPQSDDGLVTWNVMDAWLNPGAAYPLLRVTERFSAPLLPAR